MKKKEKRLHILSDAEIETIYGLPSFTPDEKALFFSLTIEEVKMIDTYSSIRSKTYCILQLGYFKATGFFHQFDFGQVIFDARYILKNYFPEKSIRLTGKIWKPLLLEQRRVILELCQYKDWNSLERKRLENKLQHIARIHANHVDIFREIISYLEINRVMLPSYRTLQDMISATLTKENLRLSHIVQRGVNKKIIKALDKLIKSNKSLSHLALLKKQPKNFKWGELSKETAKCEKYKLLYHVAKTIIPKLQISELCIQHYAELTEQYSIYYLRQMKKPLARLHLLCFLYHRFQQINDNLIASFIYNVKNFMEDSKAATDQELQEHNLKHSDNVRKVSQLLRTMVDKNISPNISYGQFLREKAFAILPADQYVTVADYLDGNSFDYDVCRWQFYADKAMQIKRNLRSIFLNINFSASTPNHSLLPAIDFLKDAFIRKKPLGQIHPKLFPKKFIPRNAFRYLKEIKFVSTSDKMKKQIRRRLHPDKYEFFVYKRIMEGIDKGDIFCNETTQYKSLKADLLSDEIWKNKEEILQNLGYPNIADAGEKSKLDELEKLLHQKILDVNKRITTGENKYFKIKGKGDKATWSLIYPKMDSEVSNPFFENIPQVNISDVLFFANNNCEFLKAFKHIKPRNAKQTADPDVLFACISANAFGAGIYKMSEMCDIKYTKLSSTEKNFIHLENLKNACDIVSNKIAELPIFKHWQIMPTILLAGLDGMKLETRLETLQSRYSPKYFGLHKGVVDYGMIVNHVPVNTKIISANDHESHFVYDIVYNNTSNINPDAVTGDTHSINQLNFVALDSIHKRFIPNYVNARRKAKIIYCFQNPAEYKDCFIKPIAKIKKNLIIEEKDNIKRVLASLALQKTTQNTIVKKLSSHKRNSRLKRALWEYNNIFMTLHLLDFIDDPLLRRYIRQALNRVEAYHQLRRAISKVHGGKLRGTSPAENEIWNQCARLLVLCIILYNGIMLSALMERQEKIANNDSIINFLRRLSPVAWIHLILTGKYRFKPKAKQVNLDVIIQKLEQKLKDII